MDNEHTAPSEPNQTPGSVIYLGDAAELTLGSPGARNEGKRQLYS